MNRKELQQLKQQITSTSNNYMFYDFVKHIDFLNNMLLKLIHNYEPCDNVELCDLSYNVMNNYTANYNDITSNDIITAYQYIIYISNRLNLNK